jgi:prepilin-type N-terminal cleavage/methylation domain-containing protein
VKPAKGFSLMELIITLVIVAALLVLGSYGLSSLWARNHLHADTKRLFHALELARSEAIKRNHTIALCPSEDFQHCSDSWNKGYIIVLENPENPGVLFQEKKSTLTHIDSGNVKKLRFRGDGHCLQRATLTLTVPDQRAQRIVLIDSGRVRIE